jgi:hypothetical protein
VKLLPIPFLLLAAVTAWASPYSQPYSIIETDTKKSSDPLLRPVIVNRVDGENTLNNRAVVPPGRHKVTLDLPPRKGFHLPTQAEMQIETKPCRRYYVAARLHTQTTQEWDPVVRYEQPIGECLKKFNLKD